MEQGAPCKKTRMSNKIWNYKAQDSVNTDLLFPGKYTYSCSTAEQIRPHLLEDLDPTFSANVQTGDLLVVGSNFGCGSSREQPVLGLKAVGIEAIVGKSFARIFYRAAINQGLLLVECPAAVDAFEEGDELAVDARNGEVQISKAGQADPLVFRFPPLPPEVLAIREAGGLLKHCVQTLRARRAGQ
eukprot:gnl/Trimastix_PCT/3229.p1 GENE.gnl/Trimastix_PCT/3229~~gnl/Trimastix_PCT/3229.p1  ORF type:complete len:200 (+),score=42.81 gnl/Trimastix_PCT/3229:45-602(+)